MKEAVREVLRVKQEVFMPLVHRVGVAQVDFGYALAKVSGAKKGDSPLPDHDFDSSVQRFCNLVLGIYKRS